LTKLIAITELTRAFEALVDIPGLWDGMRISTVHKMIGMKCDDVVRRLLSTLGLLTHNIGGLCYLNTSEWSGTGSCVTIDERCKSRPGHSESPGAEGPGSSKLDAHDLRGQLLSGQIFSAFHLARSGDDLDRAVVHQRPLSRPCSLSFEDLKYCRPR